MLQLACRVEPLFDVPPRAFRPPPKVDSAVVRLQPLPRHELHEAQPEHLYAVVKAAFGQRRKTLANALKSLLDSEAIRRAGVDPGARAETLAPAAFVRLARIYSSER
jgi:16S rRNA (adenine1518-N6/adenine1519-N6)-dimethyltransferase